MKPVYLLFGIAVILFAYRLDAFSYLESSEARYTEISREMLVSGDYVTPTLIDIRHFHKPPFTYWATAFSFHLFGLSNLSARVFPAFCGLGILILTFLMSRMVFPGKDQIHLWSVVILMSSLLFLVQARVVTTDIYLSFFTMGAIYFQWKRKSFGGSRRLVLPAAIFLALAFLTKGPIPFIFYFLPYFIYIGFLSQLRKPRLPELLQFLIIFLLITAPWFWFIIRDHPRLIDYFLVNQTLDRYATTVHHRSGFPAYYLGVLLAGMLSWFLFYFPSLILTLKQWKSRFDYQWEYLLITYTMIPLIFFSFSGSKLPAYIAPTLPFFAILLAYWIFEKYRDRPFGTIHVINTGVCILIPLVLLINPFKNTPPHLDDFHSLFWILLGIPVGFFFLYRFFLKFRNIRFEWGYGVFNIVLFISLVTVLPAVQEDLNSFEGMAKVINQHIQNGEYVVSYKIRLPSLYFYTGHRVIHLMHNREVQFETADAQPDLQRYLSNDPEKFAEFLNADTGYYIAIRRKDWEKYIWNRMELGAKADTLYENKKFLLLKNRGGN